MRTIGIILWVVIAALAIYIVWNLVSGSKAFASTGNTLARTAASNAKGHQQVLDAYAQRKALDAQFVATGNKTLIEKWFNTGPGHF